MNCELKAVVLAAGKGTRLKADDSDAPKVMREVLGKPLLWYVTDSLSFIEKKNITLVVGYKKESIINRFEGYAFAVQEQQLGTGHAVMMAKEQLEKHTGAVLVCYGDMPAIKSRVYQKLLQEHIENKNDCTLLTGESNLAMSFGRIQRGSDGAFDCIVEEKDCTEEQLKITELNTGVYVFNTQLLLQSLKELKNNNSQNEYYITDIPAIMKKRGAVIGIYKENLGDDIIGVNTTEQLEMVERILERRGNP